MSIRDALRKFPRDFVEGALYVAAGSGAVVVTCTITVIVMYMLLGECTFDLCIIGLLLSIFLPVLIFIVTLLIYTLCSRLESPSTFMGKLLDRIYENRR